MFSDCFYYQPFVPIEFNTINSNTCVLILQQFHIFIFYQQRLVVVFNLFLSVKLLPFKNWQTVIVWQLVSVINSHLTTVLIINIHPSKIIVYDCQMFKINRFFFNNLTNTYKINWQFDMNFWQIDKMTNWQSIRCHFFISNNTETIFFLKYKCTLRINILKTIINCITTNWKNI